jgi:outer membrane protein assembly factor BamA
MYPFSTTQRLEFSTGWTHIWYDLELRRTFYNQFGQPVDRQTENLETPSPLNLYSASAAYVEDNSISAFTGPIRGHRLRFEMEPTTGSLTYLNALADYRRYFYLRPFTFAIRAMHTGRYLEDSEDQRLSPNFLGYKTLVRGYSSNSFTSSECSQSPGQGCSVFNRLVGSRMALANVEFRIPVLGAEELALFRSKTIPTTLSPFFDAGYAWTKDEPFSFKDLKWTSGDTSERVPVFSTGISARVNVLGYLVAEVFYAIPFQRPEQPGYVGFFISPAW